jgi:hypothetical protein
MSLHWRHHKIGENQKPKKAREKKKEEPKFVFQFCDVGCSSQIWL